MFGNVFVDKQHSINCLFHNSRTSYINQLTTTSYQATNKHPKVIHPLGLTGAYPLLLENVRPGPSRSSLCNLRTYQWYVIRFLQTTSYLTSCFMLALEAAPVETVPTTLEAGPEHASEEVLKPAAGCCGGHGCGCGHGCCRNDFQALH